MTFTGGDGDRDPSGPPMVSRMLRREKISKETGKWHFGRSRMPCDLLNSVYIGWLRCKDRKRKDRERRGKTGRSRREEKKGARDKKKKTSQNTATSNQAEIICASVSPFIKTTIFVFLTSARAVYVFFLPTLFLTFRKTVREWCECIFVFGTAP